MRRLILGPPGTGKTERLLGEAERRLAAGLDPRRLAFVSFTRAAVREARDRARERFGIGEAALPWFRTVHSLAFRQLGLRRSDVFGRRDLRKLAEITGEELTGHSDLDAPTLGDRGDALLFLEQVARARRTSLEATWRRHGAEIDWWRLRRFVDAYRQLRRDAERVDFTDLLEAYLGEIDPAIAAIGPGAPIAVDVAMIDEAQDLTPLQWAVLDRALAGVPEIWIAGDDDQAIYAWAGATVAPLVDHAGPREVLALSYRLPRAVYALAAEVAGAIGRRAPKEFAPRDAPGTIDWVGRPEEVDLTTGTWLLLARTRRQLAELATIARGQGVAYSVMGIPAADPTTVQLILAYETWRADRPLAPDGRTRLARAGVDLTRPPGARAIWHDALTTVPLEDREYLLSCLRRGEKLLRPPRVRVSTIHGAKGAEADSVLLLTDLTARVERGMELDPDAERRVLYVAVTRARNSLFLVNPRGLAFYRL